MSQIFNYFRPEKIDSEGQLRAAQQSAKKYTAKQDAQARAAGFPSADAMYLYMQKKNTPTGGTVVRKQQGGGAGMDAAMAWHPKSTLTRAAEGLRSARER